LIFRQDKFAAALTVALLLQAVVYYSVAARSEDIPVAAPLATFPASLGSWHMQHEFPLEKEVQDVLRADDTLNREYVDVAGARGASLFIAFFKTQQYGQAPHSPKNCLPGAGWEPMESADLAIRVPHWEEPIVANKFVVSHGEQKSVVLYWYQSHNRIIASEYRAKFWLVVDALRYRRSDTALVRIVVPVIRNDINAATQTGIAFIQAAFPALLRQLPA